MGTTERQRSEAKKRVKLIHWNAAEAQGRATVLAAAGYDVDPMVPAGLKSLRLLRDNPPEAIVIDLTRLPSQGRDIGVLLRRTKRTRSIPLVFVDGDPLKVEKIRKLLPDAVFARWTNILTSLKRGISNPPREPITPKSVFEAYADSPLAKKLGVKPGSVLVLACAPRGLRTRLGPLPAGVRVTNRPSAERDLTIWFSRSRKDLSRMLKPMVGMIGQGKMWIAWPKREGNLPTDLTQQLVREAGLSHGLVDFKICSIDDTWSALLFTRRKPG